jgi:hypothetical protein
MFASRVTVDHYPSRLPGPDAAQRESTSAWSCRSQNVLLVLIPSWSSSSCRGQSRQLLRDPALILVRQVEDLATDDSSPALAHRVDLCHEVVPLPYWGPGRLQGDHPWVRTVTRAPLACGCPPSLDR